MRSIKCQFCQTYWDPRELSHHPESQEWVAGELVACPYCLDEALKLTLALSLMARAGRKERGRR